MEKHFGKLLILSTIINVLVLAFAFNQSDDQIKVPSEVFTPVVNVVDVPTNDSIVLLGNSIIKLGNWTELLEDSKVLNFGVGGTTAYEIFMSLDKKMLNRPSKVLMMVGVNDIGRGAELGMIITDIENIIYAIKAWSPNTEIVVLSVLPVNRSLALNRLPIRADNSSILQLNVALTRLTTKYHMKYIDIHEKMVNKSGKMRKDLTTDGVHLSNEGYRIMANELREVIN